MTVSSLTYLPDGLGAAAAAPRRQQPRRRRGVHRAQVVRAFVPSVLLVLARAYGAAAQVTSQADAASTASPTADDGSGCNVLDTLCLDNIDGNAGGLLLELFLFFWMFLALAIVCDDYLVASLETLCVRWEVREDVAGSTFMAFGSAAPEIIVNAVATIKSGDSSGSGSGSGGGSTSTDLGIAAIIGSGMIAFMLIPGICGFFGATFEADPSDPSKTREIPLQLKRRPLLRDVLTYSTGLLLLSVFFHDGEIVLWEALVMVCTYVGYVVMVVTAPKMRAAWRRRYEVIEDEEGHLQDPRSPGAGAADAVDSDYEDWRQPRAMRRRQRGGRVRDLLVMDRQGRRVVFPALPRVDAKVREVYARLARAQPKVVGAGTVTRGVVAAAMADADFVRQLVDAGCGDPAAWEHAFDGAAEEAVTPDGFAAVLARAQRASPAAGSFSIDGVEQPAPRKVRLLMSHEDPRIEIDGARPIPLATDCSWHRALAQVERWMSSQPDVQCSLEWDAGSKVDGWFFDRYIPATVVRRHGDNTYDVDWGDGSYSYSLSLSDLAPRNIREAHMHRPRDPQEAFQQHSKKLRECLESGALAPRVYADAIAELRERVFGPNSVSPSVSPRRSTLASPRCRRPLAGTIGVATPRPSEYSAFSGASALSVWRRRWWREEEDEQEPSPPWRWPLDALVGFWQFVFRWTIPDTALAEEGMPPNALEKFYPVAFVISFLWVAVFSFVISTIAGRWADLSGLGNGFIGLLLVSSGAEVPDCIQSVTVAKRGYGSMACSNAIGSQNVNVLIGLGLPWLVFNAALGKPVKVHDHASLQVAAFFQCGAIFLNLFLLIGVAFLTGETKAQLGRKKGYMLMAAYFCVLTGFALYDQLH